MDIFDYELAAYEEELKILDREYEEMNYSKKDFNLTTFTLSRSNRGHLIVIGLCSLVEALMYGMCLEEEPRQEFKLGDIHGTGRINSKHIYLELKG